MNVCIVRISAKNIPILNIYQGPTNNKILGYLFLQMTLLNKTLKILFYISNLASYLISLSF